MSWCAPVSNEVLDILGRRKLSNDKDMGMMEPEIIKRYTGEAVGDESREISGNQMVNVPICQIKEFGGFPTQQECKAVSLRFKDPTPMASAVMYDHRHCICTVPGDAIYLCCHVSCTL